MRGLLWCSSSATTTTTTTTAKATHPALPSPPSQPMQTLVCRRTLAGHTDDVLSLGGVGVAVSAPDISQLVSPGSPSTAAMAAGLSPLGLPVGPAPGSPTAMSGSPRAGLERALLFVSAGADGTVRLWSGEKAARPPRQGVWLSCPGVHAAGMCPRCTLLPFFSRLPPFTSPSSPPLCAL